MPRQANLISVQVNDDISQTKIVLIEWIFHSA